MQDAPQSHFMSGVKADIADATIRVIARAGFDVVSVRTVAKEAGLAPGTVQYHFRSREDLLVGAMVRNGQRIVTRLAELPPEEHVAKRLLRGLTELLPLDGPRQEEGILWVALSSAASTRPSLTTPYLEGLAFMRDTIRQALIRAQQAGALRDGWTPESGAFFLAALTNGLTIDGINAPESDHPRLLQALADGVRNVVNMPDD